VYVGTVSRCPGFIDVTLDDWTTSEELFHYDLVVLCPPHVFNATFYLPHRALAGTSNRTFLVTLNDTKRRRHFFLTAVQHTNQRGDDDQAQLSEGNPYQQAESKPLVKVVNVKKSFQGQLSKVVDDEAYQTLARVLLMATVALFCCLLILTLSLTLATLQRLRRFHASQHFKCRRAAACRWKLTIAVFVVIKTIYSLTFTFSGTIVTYQLVLGESSFGYDDGKVQISTAMKSGLFRRLVELKRSRTLSSLEEKDEIAMQQLRSLVVASNQYVDDLLSVTAFQTAQNRRHNQTYCALDQLRRVYNKFQLDVAEYVRWQKIQLGSVVAQSAAEQVKLRLDGLLDNDWLRYPRTLFETSVTSAVNNTSRNVSISNEQFTAFFEAGDELKAIRKWTAAVDKR